MNSSEIRIGQGLDIHAFGSSGALILGGVLIEESPGLIGHSDADALVHALIDALLGAAGKEDIGVLFPNTDRQWKDADSMKLLEMVWSDLQKESWQIINLDSTIITEAPKLSPYIPAMKEKLSTALDIDLSACGIKATTSEKMGFIGKGQGLMAMCVVLLQRKSIAT